MTLQELNEMFPNALAALLEHCEYGSRKHSPGEPVHWAFHKSTDHVNKAIGHLARAGHGDPETGRSHTINGLWRALAAAETEYVEDGYTPGKLVRF